MVIKNMIFLLFVKALADEMWYNDVDNGVYYEWSSLQSK